MIARPSEAAECVSTVLCVPVYVCASVCMRLGFQQGVAGNIKSAPDKRELPAACCVSLTTATTSPRAKLPAARRGVGAPSLHSNPCPRGSTFPLRGHLDPLPRLRAGHLWPLDIRDRPIASCKMGDQERHETETWEGRKASMEGHHRGKMPGAARQVGQQRGWRRK